MFPPNVELHWNELASVLDISDKSDALPFAINCPLCKAAKSLVIFQDTTHNSDWHHCKECGSFGDMIELASRIWGMSIEATCVELAKKGVPSCIGVTPDAVTRYLDTGFKSRTKAIAGWNGCVTYFKKPTHAVNELLSLFNLQQRKWETFNPQPERYFAATHVRELEKALGNQYRHYVGSKKKGHLYERIDTMPIRFPGGWSDTLVMPYETLPGHISGFLCVGYRHGKLQRIFTRARGQGNTFKRAPVPYDAGLWGLHTSIYGKTTAGDYALAVEDPLLALRIQSRHSLMSNTPLPIVTWRFDGATTTQGIGWQGVRQKNIVVVSCKMTPSVIHAAYSSGGLLTILDISENDFFDMIKTKKPEDLMRYIIRRALPWRDTVRRWMTTSAPNVVKEFFNTLALRSTDADDIANEFKEQFSDNTAASNITCVRIPNNQKTIVNIVENASGWFVRLSVSDYIQLTDFSVRFKTVFRRARGTQVEGNIYFKGQTLPVTFDSEILTSDRAFEHKIFNVCLASGLGMPKINADGFSLIQITRLFEEPKTYAFTMVTETPEDEEIEDLNIVPVN